MWKSIIVIKPESIWKFTPEIEGSYFRLRHIDTPRSPTGWIGQAEPIPNTNFHTFFGTQRVNGLSIYEVIQLEKPPIFSTRKLAFRQETRTPNDWLIEVEVNTEMPSYPLEDAPVVNPVAATSKIKTQVTVSTTATKILSANPNRKAITIYNPENLKSIYVDTDSTVNTASAIGRIGAKSVYIPDILWQGEYWAVTQSGTATLDIEEYV